MSSLVDRAIVATLPRVPRAIVGRVASRSLAGERLEQAVAAIREINARGLPGSVAILGESVRSERDARARRPSTVSCSRCCASSSCAATCRSSRRRSGSSSRPSSRTS